MAVSSRKRIDGDQDTRASGLAQMTEELFREDSFARQCQAAVTGVVEGGVALDRTVFYSTGGGQPGDRGQAHPKRWHDP